MNRLRALLRRKPRPTNGCEHNPYAPCWYCEHGVKQ